MHLDALQSQHCERQYCEQKFSRLDYSYGILVIGGLKNPPPPKTCLSCGPAVCMLWMQYIISMIVGDSIANSLYCMKVMTANLMV